MIKKILKKIKSFFISLFKGLKIKSFYKKIKPKSKILKDIKRLQENKIKKEKEIKELRVFLRKDKTNNWQNFLKTRKNLNLKRKYIHTKFNTYFIV